MTAVALMVRYQWLLRSFMAQYKITNRELAKESGKHPTTIARMKASDNIPSVGGEDIADICNALTRILKTRKDLNGNPINHVVRLTDLVKELDSD